MPGLPEPLDPATLDKLRRGFPLRMDRQGGFTFEGDPLTHPGVVALFRKGIDCSEAGEIELHVADQWTYLNVDDLPLRAVRVDVPRTEESAPMLLLDDGRRLPLDPATLWEEPGAGLRCTVPSQRSARPLGVRLSNRAAIDLGEWMVWPDADEAGRPELVIAGRRWAIPERAPTQGDSAPSGIIR